MTTKSQMQLAIETLRTELIDLRGKHAKAKADAQIIRDKIEELHNAPIAPEDLSRYIRRFIHDKGEDFASNLMLNSMFNGRSPLHTTPWGVLEKIGFGGYFLEARRALATDFFGMLCFFFPDAVEAKLTDRITSTGPTSWGTKATPLSEREAQIADLLVELGQLETVGQNLASQIDQITAAMDS